jgi:chromosome segregation protein
LHLKSIEIVGFKSFADKVKLMFEPGMTAIVGPNGCGKSNVSDAIRWVIGEQSPKAMRSSKMTDVIFNGTDKRKPLGMAEVSVTFTGCEDTLDVEYDEVTITRRVFQSGDGQYFINKTPCRLKDIHRLLMDTGIGSSSYSFMMQGRIDQILSSRPEDRRSVFEEASGITKYKADKKEAIRKLEHTEANLIRLADVIREVKRQIGSLQRQAGKARRYKTFSAELRQLDIYATRENLKIVDNEITSLKTNLAKAEQQLAVVRREVDEIESSNVTVRESLVKIEREIATTQEHAVEFRSKLEHTRELITVNLRQIEEYRTLAQKDSREIEESTRMVVEQETRFAELGSQIKVITEKKIVSEQELKRWNEMYASHQEQIDNARSGIHKLRSESVELEMSGSRLHNQLVEVESRERSAVIKRERLAAEKAQLERVVKNHDERQIAMKQELGKMQQDVAAFADKLNILMRDKNSIIEQINGLQQKQSDIQSRLASLKMKSDMLLVQDADKEDMPAGARALLGSDSRFDFEHDNILGSLASVIDVDSGFDIAVEAALRTKLDAIVIRNDINALKALRCLSEQKIGAAVLLAADIVTDTVALPANADLLVNHINCTDELKNLLKALIGHVVIVESLDSLSVELGKGVSAVTLDGSILHSNGHYEYWMRDQQDGSTALARKQLIKEAKDGIATLEAELEEGRLALDNAKRSRDSIDEQIAESRQEIDALKRDLARKEGEDQVITREAAESRDRQETVTWELEALISENESGENSKDQLIENIADVKQRRVDVMESIASQSRELQKSENRHAELQTNLTEHRINYSEVCHRFTSLEQQYTASQRRLEELKSIISGRSEGIKSYQDNIAALTESVEESQGQIGDLESGVAEYNDKIEKLKVERDKQYAEVRSMEQVLAEKRERLEEVRETRSRLDVKLAECQVKRQNQLDRTTSEYNINLDQLIEEPDPDWDGDAPDIDVVENKIAELRTKLEAMGPVNLVAIEEYKEHEERYAFLTTQEHDLITAKQQLMDMIRKINQTTTELFSQTFHKVNENFQSIFKTLFSGGSANLVLVNEEDILECGIEIIARPPGKRLQNVSLLSGGERTMTAVALLFAVYMIKPSPFCMLDELDAALDDSNIGRFVDILKGFLEQSQFVVITHSRQTIASANVIYGVTMPERGVSRIVSMKFSNYEKELLPENGK